MVSWSEFAEAEPEFAERVRGVLDAHVHKTMATLRRDGSPRISGTEADIRNGDLWLGGGTSSVKVRDLLRDPRVAVHSAPLDKEMIEGDAKVAGRAVEVTDDAAITAAFEARPEGATFFRLDLDEVVLTRVVDAARLEIELWRPGAGVRTLIGA